MRCLGSNNSFNFGDLGLGLKMYFKGTMRYYEDSLNKKQIQY